MRKTKRKTYVAFDWSRHPSKDGVNLVFLADPNAYTTFGKDITKDEFAYCLATYNRINELESKKQALIKALHITLLFLPITFFLYNITIGVTR